MGQAEARRTKVKESRKRREGRVAMRSRRCSLLTRRRTLLSRPQPPPLSRSNPEACPSSSLASSITCRHPPRALSCRLCCHNSNGTDNHALVSKKKKKKKKVLSVDTPA